MSGVYGESKGSWVRRLICADYLLLEGEAQALPGHHLTPRNKCVSLPLEWACLKDCISLLLLLSQPIALALQASECRSLSRLQFTHRLKESLMITRNLLKAQIHFAN